MANFPEASRDTMKKSDSVVVLAAGPSLKKCINRVIEWKRERKAIVIASHYRYLLDANYTVFTTPEKFRNGQDKIAGKLIIGPRIRRRDINKNNYKKILRMKYSKTRFLDWTDSQFVENYNKIPPAGCGLEAVILSVFCNPKNILLAGFDGFEILKNRLVVRHARSCTLKAKPKRSLDLLNNKKKETTMIAEIKRRQIIFNLFKYFIFDKNINVFIFGDDKFKGIDKEKLKTELGVNII